MAKTGKPKVRRSRLLLAVAFGMGVSLPGSVVRAERADLGINISWCTDWIAHHLFADVMKTAREPWSEAGDGWTDLAPNEVDAHGWPLKDAKFFVWIARDMQGTYKLSFTGQAVVNQNASYIKNKVYDPSTNKTTADVVLTDSGLSTFVLEFTGTSGGVKDVKLMRPTSPGSATSYPENVHFTTAFRDAVAPFSTLRLMQTLSTNTIFERHWSERVKPNHCTFDVAVDPRPAWEYVILMANELQKDIWICIPLHADDDYVRQLALLMRDGGTDDQGNVYPPLDPARKVYIEYSNEIWNYNVDPAEDLAQAEVQSGDPNGLNFDGINDRWEWLTRRTLSQSVKFSETFREVFGDAAMMTRIRPLFVWQVSRAENSSEPLIEYFEKLPSRYPHPLSYYFYGGGGAAYYNPDFEGGTYTLNTLWSSETMDLETWRPWIEWDTIVCNMFGIKYVSYEGGPSFDPEGDSVLAQAWGDPRITTSIVDHHNFRSNLGGDLLMYYTLTQNAPGDNAPDYRWDFLKTVFQPSSAKYQAILDLETAARAPLTFGNSIGAAVPGNSYDLKSWYANTSYMGNPVSFSNACENAGNCWVGYEFNVPADGAYTVTVRAQSGAGAGLNLIVDGRFARSWTLAPAAQDVTYDANFTQGMHSVRLRAPGSEVRVDTVRLTASNIVDNTPPVPAVLTAAFAPAFNRVTLAWTAATDAHLIGYDILRNGAVIGQAASGETSFTDSSPAGSTTYAYIIRARDIGGNTADSNALSVTTPANGSGGGTGGGTTPSAVVVAETAAFPSPAVGVDPTIRCFVGDADILEVTIFDASGGLVRSEKLAERPDGAVGGRSFHDFPWTGKKSSGVYFAVVHGKTGGEVIRGRTKFTVVR